MYFVCVICLTVVKAACATAAPPLLYVFLPSAAETRAGAEDPAPAAAAKDSLPPLKGGKPDAKTLDDVESPLNNNWFLLVLAARRGLTFLEQHSRSIQTGWA